jgi:hypothetical protein
MLGEISAATTRTARYLNFNVLVSHPVPAPMSSTKLLSVVPISEVIPSRGVRVLEGEGRGLSHLEVIARGRLWRQLASRGID